MFLFVGLLEALSLPRGSQAKGHSGPQPNEGRPALHRDWLPLVFSPQLSGQGSPGAVPRTDWMVTIGLWASQFSDLAGQRQPELVTRDLCLGPPHPTDGHGHKAELTSALLRVCPQAAVRMPPNLGRQICASTINTAVQPLSPGQWLRLHTQWWLAPPAAQASVATLCVTQAELARVCALGLGKRVTVYWRSHPQPRCLSL